MAATTGFGEFSISESTSLRPGGFGGLPNSVMSAPAMKVRPAQVSTIAFASGSAIARLMPSRIPPRTAALSAFTGGLLTVMTATASLRSSLTTSFTLLSLWFCSVDFALRNLIPHLDTEGYFEARRLSTRSAQQQAMKRPGKKVATDRNFVVALSRGLDVLRAFRPNDGLLGNQEIAARTNLPKPTVSRLTYTLTKLGYLTPVPRFEKYQLAPSAMALGYAALANLGVRHLSEAYREEVMRETGGAVAVGGRDRLSMIYFGQSRNGLTLGVQLDVGSRIPIATTAMGRAYIWALPGEERASLLRELREHYGSRWLRMRDGIERAGETVAKLGFAISAGEWQNDVHAVGVALKLKDGTGPYAFNCGAPAFRFTEDRLRHDIGPRLVAMVRNIEAALGGTPQSKKDDNKKLKAGGKVARVVEGIR